MKFFTISLIALALLQTPQVKAQAETKAVTEQQSAAGVTEGRYVTMDQLFAERKYSKLNEMLANVETQLEFEGDLMWLQRASMTGHSAWASFAYGQALWQAFGSKDDPQTNQVKGTSAAMLVHSLMILDIDGARCADRTAPSDRQYKIMSTKAPVFAFAKEADQTTKDQIITIVTLLETSTFERRRQNFDSAFLCTGGMAQIAAGLAEGRVKERPAKEGELGRQFVVDDDGKYVPELIGEQKWLKIAAEKRGKLEASVRTMLDMPAKTE